MPGQESNGSLNACGKVSCIRRTWVTMVSYIEARDVR